jgi:hypothetical protein
VLPAHERSNTKSQGGVKDVLFELQRQGKLVTGGSKKHGWWCTGVRIQPTVAQALAAATLHAAVGGGAHHGAHSS